MTRVIVADREECDSPLFLCLGGNGHCLVLAFESPNSGPTARLPDDYLLALRTT